MNFNLVLRPEAYALCMVVQNESQQVQKLLVQTETITVMWICNHLMKYVNIYKEKTKGLHLDVIIIYIRAYIYITHVSRSSRTRIAFEVPDYYII